jgi:FixJ family two-component response regulator
MSIHPGIVYVVDDDEAFRDSVAWLLQTNGYQARLFPDAESLLKEIKPGVGGPPRCIVLDVRMPGMTGPEAQEALRERNQKRGLRFSGETVCRKRFAEAH